MVRWVRMAASACIGMLCLLLLSCLVQQGGATAAEPEQALPVHAAVLIQRCVIPAESAAPTADRRVPERFGEVAEVLHEDHLPATAPSCDGNGWIITGRTWPRTVYAVCPPEGMPG